MQKCFGFEIQVLRLNNVCQYTNDSSSETGLFLAPVAVESEVGVGSDLWIKISHWMGYLFALKKERKTGWSSPVEDQPEVAHLLGKVSTERLIFMTLL